MKNGLPWRVRVEMRKQKNATPAPSVRRVAVGHNPHERRGITPWKPGRLFDGRVVAVVGGGPSLKGYDFTPLTESGAAIIVVNNSYKLLPNADILHFADAAWWQWNGKDVLANWPNLISTATSDTGSVNDKRIKRLWRNRNEFSTEEGVVHGWDSGTQAVNLAYLLGARKIVLFGIDMQPGTNGETQWHKEHKRPTNTSNYAKRFAPSLAESVRRLSALGVPVVRATEPGIPEAPCLPLELALG